MTPVMPWHPKIPKMEMQCRVKIKHWDTRLLRHLNNMRAVMIVKTESLLAY